MSHPSWMTVLVSVAGTLAVASTALAQNTPATPGNAPAPTAGSSGGGTLNMAVNVTAPKVLVTTGPAELRCGDAFGFYAVARVQPGTKLLHEGASNDYMKVAYPAGSKAFVAGDELIPDAAGRTGKLARPSRLKAANADAGPRASWNTLTERDLPAGTELTIVETVSEGGKPIFFGVTPPKDAFAFISKQSVREATADEAAAFLTSIGLGAPAPAPAPAPAATPAPVATPAAAPAATTPAAPVAAPTAAPTTATAATPTTPAPAPATISTVAPMPGTTPPLPGDQSAPKGNAGTPAAPAAGTEPKLKPTAPGEPEAAPVAPMTPAAEPQANPAPAAKVTEAIRSVSPTEELNAIFQRVQKQPLEEAEFEQAIARFDQYAASLGTMPGEVKLKDRVKRMEEVIKMRMEIRDSQRKNRDADAAIKASRAGMRTVIEQYEKQRIYTIIGRLIPSTVYDGTRLPLLYRVHSPEPGTARTLGYLQPDAGMDLTSKLGQIVGVVGDTRYDETLKATLITARKVDVVSLAPVQAVPAAEGEKKPAETKPAEPKKDAKPTMDDVK